MTSPRSGSSFRTCSNASCARPYSLLCSKSRLPRLQRVVTSAHPPSSSVSTSAGPTDGTSPVRRVHTNIIYSVLYERVLKCAPSGFFDRDSLRIFSAPKHRRACTFCLLMLSLWSHRPQCHGYTRWNIILACYRYALLRDGWKLAQISTRHTYDVAHLPQQRPQIAHDIRVARVRLQPCGSVYLLIR